MNSGGFILPAVLLLGLPACAGQAQETCPWLNAATAGGVLGGPVAAVTVKRDPPGGDASCEFTRRDGSALFELRIEVETMGSPAKDFQPYIARCHSAGAPLKAIGNEALACRDEGGEQVVGRVRNRAFVVRVTTNGRSSQPSELREKARKVAEQVAGILF
jgi:hypothetical protein